MRMPKANKPNIETKENGPYVITHLGDVNTSRGEAVKSAKTMVFCRCGQSGSRPHCDGTHWYIQFKDLEKDIPLAKSGEETIFEYLGNLKRNSDEFEKVMEDIHRTSVTGESIIEPMRTTHKVVAWDDILIKGAQLATFPLNDDEPVKTQTVIGPRAKQPLVIETPIYVTHMSFGALSRDIKIALAMGADAIAIGTAALMAVACQQYRICHTGECPVGVTTQKTELRTRLSTPHSAKKLENFLRVSTNEIKTFARLSGHNNIHDLSTKDLMTDNSEISNHTNIEHV